MAEITRETINTQNTKSNGVPTDSVKTAQTAQTTTVTKNEATSYQTLEYLVYFSFGVLEILLAFRLVLKVMGASTSSAFVNLIYGITGIFILPFEGIFSKWFTKGAETTSILEPATIVAMIVYAVLAWGIVKLIRISSGAKQQAD